MALDNQSAAIPYSDGTTYPAGTIGKRIQDLLSEIISISVPNGSITAAKLASDAVTTAKILDANVTTAKLAANAVTLAKLVQATAQNKFLIRTSSGAGDFQEGTFSANGLSLVGAADYAAMRALLDLEAGTDFNAYSAKTAAIAALTWAADKLMYFTGTGAVATMDFPAAGRALAASGASADLVASINAQTGTSYTLVAGDRGKLLSLTNAGAIAVTLPADAAVGFYCSAYQRGAGQVTFAAASGGTLVNRQSHTKTAGQHSGVGLAVFANAGGSAAQWTLTGDTAA
jgi:hypothetical protein